MNEIDQEHPHTNYKTDEGHHGVPYWKRAHHDWKFWFAIVLMLIAMAVYLRTNDLSVRPHAPVQQPVP